LIRIIPVITDSIYAGRMLTSKSEFANWNDFDLPGQGRPKRTRLLTPLGWFATLVVIAIVTGMALGLVA
jgi:hypothetical protein